LFGLVWFCLLLALMQQFRQQCPFLRSVPMAASSDLVAGSPASLAAAANDAKPVTLCTQPGNSHTHIPLVLV
jgi:hypothetical protein